MAGVRINKEAKERKFVLMPEGTQVIKVTKVEVKPKGKPQVISIEAKNKDGVVITNRWDITKDMQESMFWLFYNTGCGLEEDADGFTNPDDMVGRYVLIDVVHRQGKPMVNEETGEVKPPRIFANFGYIHGNADGFDGEEPSESDDVDDDDGYELD